MGGRGMFVSDGTDPRSEAEQLQILADAGISAEDVDLVVQHHLRHEHESARAHVEVLLAARSALERHGGACNPVPQADRWDLGPIVTATDLVGAGRALSAAITHAQGEADRGDTQRDITFARSATVAGMVRRETEGRHDENLRLIEGARPRSGGHVGNGG